MAERTRILDINIESIIKKSSDLKKELDDLRKAQAELRRNNDTSSESYVRLEARLRNVSSEYSMNQRQLANLVSSGTEFMTVSQRIDAALNREITTVEQANQTNRELARLRNQVNVTTDEGRASLLLLNGALNRNNEFIRQNSSQLEQQRINIGNYGNAFTEAAQSINPLNGGLLGFASRAQEAGGAGVLLRTAIGGMTGAMFQLIKASLAFLATPLGAAIGLLAGAFLAVRSAMNRSEESAGKVSKLFSALGGVFNMLLKILQPIGEFVIDKLVGAFETLGNVAEGAARIVSKSLSFLGFDEAAKSVDEFTNSTKESIKASRDLASAEKELEKAQRQARMIQLQFQKDAEKLRQIRDDESKSIDERIKANDDLGATLQKQIGEELKIAQLRLDVVNKQIAKQGKTKELLDAQAEALTEIVDIEERITGQQSEQLVNRVSLLKEENEKRQEARQKRIDAAIKEQSDLIKLYQAEQGFKVKTLEESYLIEQELTKKRLRLLETEFANKRKTETEYQAERLEIENEFLLKTAQLNEEFARRELESQLEKLPEIIGKEKFISDAILQAENERLTKIENLRKDFEAKRFEQGLISETEYQNSITAIQQDIQAQRDEADALRLATIEEANKINLENKRAIEDQIFAQDLEIQLGRLEEQRLIEIEAATKVGADIQAINENFRLKEIQAIREAQEQKRIARLEEVRSVFGFYGDMIGALESFFGKNKQLAIASAIINGGIAVTEILKAPAAPFVEPFASVVRGVQIAKVIGTTKQAVTQIKSASYADGGIPNEFKGTILEGPSHAHGGIPTPFGEMEGKEAIINKRSTEMFKPLLSAINVAGGGRSFARGGIPNTNLSTVMRNFDRPAPANIDYDLLKDSMTEASKTIDYDLMASKMAEAVKQIPPNKLILEEFNSTNDSYNEIITGANF